jgi:serine phosphatase RsbU (regulator of sigma subunit)/anti-sigma regulatory factor (Ser/Thr protein kinase)
MGRRIAQHGKAKLLDGPVAIATVPARVVRRGGYTRRVESGGSGEADEREVHPRVSEGGEAIIGATLEGLRRAAAEVEQVASTAETLQRALLPAQLPEVAGLAMAGRYLAAGEEGQVGGDWYDVIALRDGRAGIAIGDVVGHGVQAAARMAHLQSAARAFALEGLRPSLLLERVNAFAYDDERPTMATLLYGVIDPDAGTMRLASAAHPPPLVIQPSGAATFVEGARGSPLGARQYPSYEEGVVMLEPGASVVIFTDGLVETPDASLEEGLERLRAGIGTLPQDPEQLSEALLELRFAETAPRDDVAIVVVRLEAEGAETLELSVPADPESLARIRRSVGRWLRGAGASDTESYEVLVACGEACANAIAHAYPVGNASFEVNARRLNGSIELEIRDFGSWREPRPGTGARGLSLMHELMDDVELERRSPGGTTVTMRRKLGGAR